MTTPRIIFAGTPEFALVSLKALVASGRTPVAILTQPDRPAGRGRKLTASPVKQYAEQQGIPVRQPLTLGDDAVVRELAAFESDLMIVAAYGLLLPQAVLDLPRVGCLNVHASLLPRWRGAAPIQAAILAGDDVTGVCLMAMEAGLDCGAIFASEDTPIGAAETAGELHDRLASMGASLLIDKLDDIVAGRIEAAVQDETLVTYAPKIHTGDAELDWRLPAVELWRRVRAYNPVPGAWFILDNSRIKCWEGHVLADADGAPGQVVAAGTEGVTVACGEGALTMTVLQRPGKRAVTGAELAAQLELAGRQL